jgi:hypothetical protein
MDMNRFLFKITKNDKILGLTTNKVLQKGTWERPDSKKWHKLLKVLDKRSK